MLYNGNGNGGQFATACEVKKALSMVEQLRGQMHALQFQIDTVKSENVRLTTLVAELEDAHAKQQTEMEAQQAAIEAQRAQLGTSAPRSSVREMDTDNASVRSNHCRINKGLRNLKGKKQAPNQGGHPRGQQQFGGSGNGNSNSFD